MQQRPTFHTPDSADPANLSTSGTIIAWAASTLLIAISLTLLVLR